jgi:methionine-gamma-lyase
MDSMRSASVLKNLRSLHIRMKQHSHNAAYLAQSFADMGVRTIYPGLTSHPQHQLFSRLLNPGYGCGGMVVVDMGTKQAAYRLMEAMQEAKVGYLAVSLGFFRTLFSSPGSSTSSEIPEAERIQMGLTDGLVRISVGLDNDMAAIFQRISRCLEAVMI